jgi:hypothetical protein
VCEVRRHEEEAFGMPQETVEQAFIERTRAVSGPTDRLAGRVPLPSGPHGP